MVDRRLVESLAEDLGTLPGLIEKDWHVVRALGVIAAVDRAGMMPAFSGGTSLSKGWELIKRFSEDIDFKVGEPAASSASRARRERTAYRERVLAALTGSGFEIIGEPYAGNASRFFSADVAYGAQFGGGQGLRRFGRISASRFRRGAWSVPPVSGCGPDSLTVEQNHSTSCPAATVDLSTIFGRFSAKASTVEAAPRAAMRRKSSWNSAKPFTASPLPFARKACS